MNLLQEKHGFCYCLQLCGVISEVAGPEKEGVCLLGNYISIYVHRRGAEVCVVEILDVRSPTSLRGCAIADAAFNA